MRVVLNLFADVYSFLKKNRVLLLFPVISLLLNQLVVSASRNQVVSVKYLAQFMLLLVNAVIDLFVILSVYKLSGITPNANTVVENVYLYLRRCLGVTIIGEMLAIFIGSLLIIPFVSFSVFQKLELPNFIVWFFIVVFGVLYLAFVRLGYQILILKNTIIWDSIKLGYRELNRNLHFYLQVSVVTIVLFLVFDLLVFLLIGFRSYDDNTTLFLVSRRVSIALSIPIITVIYTMAFLSKNPIIAQ